MEKLEAKHIAPYLPYKLMFWHTKLKNKQEMSKIKIRQDGDVYVDVESDTLVYISSINDSWIKPILRPLSDLKEDNYYFTYCNNSGFMMKGKNETYIRLNDLEYLFKNHFDVFGLIDKGLAISYSDVQSMSNEG